MREPELEWQSSCGKIEITFKSYDTVYELATVHKDQKAEALKNIHLDMYNEVKNFSTEDMINVLRDNDIEVENLNIIDMQKELIFIAASDLHDRENMEELCEWQNDFLSERLENYKY